jgi:hypothetical protein
MAGQGGGVVLRKPSTDHSQGKQICSQQTRVLNLSKSTWTGTTIFFFLCYSKMMATDINKHLYWQYWREPTINAPIIYAIYKTHSVCRFYFHPYTCTCNKDTGAPWYTEWYHRLLAAGWLASHRRVSGEDDGWGQLNEETMKLGPRGISWSRDDRPFPASWGCRGEGAHIFITPIPSRPLQVTPMLAGYKTCRGKQETTKGILWIENKERKGRSLSWSWMQRTQLGVAKKIRHTNTQL